MRKMLQCAQLFNMACKAKNKAGLFAFQLEKKEMKHIEDTLKSATGAMSQLESDRNDNGAAFAKENICALENS